MLTPLEKTSTFAGFSWPRYYVTLPQGSLSLRLAYHKAKRERFSGYYHDVVINPTSGTFYAGDIGDNLPWRWCDVIASRIRHKGWYCDNDQMETMRGIVITLPNRRGFLAGWSMGHGMTSAFEYTIYSDDITAAYAADSLAERVAEREREYHAQQTEQLENDLCERLRGTV